MRIPESLKFFLLNPESGKNWHVEKGNLGFGIRNTAQKIQNRPSDWNPVPGIRNP